MAVRDRFPGGEVTSLFFNYSEGSNEGIIGKEAEMRGSMVKCEERPLERPRDGGGVCVIPVRFPMNYGAMKTVKYMWGRYLVHATLDYWIMSQDCRNTFPWHELLKI